MTQIVTFVGLDLGKKTSYAHATDREGKALKRGKLENNRADFGEFFVDLPRPIRVVIEAMGSWAYAYEILEGLGIEEVQLANPYRTRLIAESRIKTDKIDARILAMLSRADLIAQAYIAPRPVRDLREQLRHRAFVVQMRTKVKNRIHAYLGKLGHFKFGFTDLFGKKGRAWLKAAHLPAPYRELIDQALGVLDNLTSQVKEIDEKVDRMAALSEEAQILMSFPGIGKYWALLILSEIGDINRFPSPKKLVSYSGLCPSTHQSGSRIWNGHITRQGSKWLRLALVEAAQFYGKRSDRLGDYYRRIAAKKGSKTARVAVAREMLTAIYHCLKKGVHFQENPTAVSKSAAQEFCLATRW